MFRPLSLAIGVPLSGCKVMPQLFGGAAWSVSRRIALDAPPFLQRSSVDCIETESIEQVRHCRLGARVVAGDDERPAVLRAGGLSVRGEVRGVDMVERLD